MCNEFVRYQAQNSSGAWNSSGLVVPVSAGFPDCTNPGFVPGISFR